jgi:hypothetical protein
LANVVGNNKRKIEVWDAFQRLTIRRSSCSTRQVNFADEAIGNFTAAIKVSQFSVEAVS